jgi:DNA-binding XRE family transcriptional regulator
LGITQEMLAERADLHRTYIAEIENGKRNVTLKCIEKLARALKVSIDSLFLPDGGGTVKVKFSSSESSNAKLSATQPAGDART